MPFLDSSGREVSLLNDEPSHDRGSHDGYPSSTMSSNGDDISGFRSRPPLVYRSAALHGHHEAPSSQDLLCAVATSSWSSSSSSSARSDSSAPMTPELTRSESYDSRASNNDPVFTPFDIANAHGHGQPQPYQSGSTVTTPYDDYSDCMLPRRSTFADAKYDDEPATGPPAVAVEKAAKRYPCRYRDIHGCDKTFTTSGHASRHSKIHTAEKAVKCTHPNCQKKFTRADNMKQHLETHYKDKSRASASQRSLSSRTISNTGSSSNVRRSSITSSSSRASGSVHYQPQAGTAAAKPPCVEWEMSGMDLPSLGRPMTLRTTSGLDALAMATAIACQDAGVV